MRFLLVYGGWDLGKREEVWQKSCSMWDDIAMCGPVVKSKG